jgi:uncharacterized protein (DUF2252 family)
VTSLSLVERIQRYNADREPERLRLKYEAMRKSPFGFLRGTSHLFHEDWRREPALDRTPLAWITGDLHLENFGSYKGDNRLAYFDLNDFDEATLAPCARDLARFLTSVLVAAPALNVSRRGATTLGRSFLAAYRAALAQGKARWVERQTAGGMVRALLEDARFLTRERLLRIRTRRTGRSRELRIGRRALPVGEREREKVARVLKQFANREPDPKFYSLVDVARRVAGTASLGLDRYVLLVKGRGAPDKMVLLDLKQAVASSLVAPALPRLKWPTDALRVVTIQRWAQAVSPALLHPVQAAGRSYVLRELQPTQDRLSLEVWNGNMRHLEGVMIAMGQIAAWSHLRSGGRQGSAIADEWIAFAGEKRWTPALLEYAEGYSRRVEQNWREFVAWLSAL